MWLAWISWVFLLITTTLPRGCPASAADDNYRNLEELGVVELERRIPIPIFITITLTTTIITTPNSFSTASMATHTPIPWTVPGGSIPQITFTRSKTSFTNSMTATGATSITKTSLSVSSTVESGSTIVGATSSSGLSAIPSVSSTTFTTTTSSSGSLSPTGIATTSAASTSSSQIASVSSALSTSAISSAVDGSSPVPSSEQTTTTAPPPASLENHSLAGGQIAAVVVGAVAFTVFVSVVAYLVRFAIMRRRQNSAEKRQRLDGEAMAQYYPGAAASRSSHAMRSLREDEFRIVIRTPPPAEERPHQLWPNPPGGTQRFTFFSGRSTTTATDSATDPATDRGQWSLGTEHGSSGRSHGTPHT